jgi:hypothetical protein
LGRESTKKAKKKEKPSWSRGSTKQSKKGKKKGEVRAGLYPLGLEPRDTTPHVGADKEPDPCREA